MAEAASFSLAEKTGSETLLSRIITLVGSAQRSKAPIQRMADAAANKFTPIVLAIALATFIGWFFWALNLGSRRSSQAFQFW